MWIRPNPHEMSAPTYTTSQLAEAAAVGSQTAFPVGSVGGDPVFRFTVEVNRFRTGFFTPDVLRSRRYDLGAEHF